MPSSSIPSPFVIDVSDADMRDLSERLAHARFPQPTAGSWQAGTDPAYLRELVTYWRDEFDWRARERELNAIPQFTVDIDGQRVHFVHVRGPYPEHGTRPLPLILTHGWPSSFVEMLPLVARLTDPAGHGGNPNDVFDVIIPSLPGFLFSDSLCSSPTIPPAVADLWARLMTVLGYPRFGAYGGDIGADVTGFLGAQPADRVLGVYTHHPNLHPALEGARPLSAAEQGYLDLRRQEKGDDGGYAAIQSTRPDTLAAALIDSPSGLAAWLVEKYRSWSDCGGDVEARFTKDTLLTIITLYWVTHSIGSSFRPYFDDDQAPPLPRVDVPTGITLTPEDAAYPREFAARSYTNIVQWKQPTSGGHFLALEEPDLLAADLRSFFGPLRETEAGFSTPPGG
jgi:pimeloyl-ACP methyl ester carboxylesterase